MKIQTRILTFFALAGSFGFYFFSANSNAAEIRTDMRDPSLPLLIIEGAIKKGDYQKFLGAVEKNKGLLGHVFIYSPGGDFEEAMKIGRAMRKLELYSTVPRRNKSGEPECDDSVLPGPLDPANCVAASAGFFIHIGAVHRTGDFLAVHRPYFEQDRFGALTEQSAKKSFDALQVAARRYMTEMDVPTHIQEDVLGTPSNKALVLDSKTVATYFTGYLPSRHEWLIAKCSSITPQERADYDDYLDRYPRISHEEMAETKRILQKKKPEEKCNIEAMKKSRLVAYESFFGKSVSDYAGYSFKSWADAARYIGMSMQEVMPLGGFDAEVESDGRTVLTKHTGANVPTILLFVKSNSRKNIGSVAVLSLPNPSDKFAENLKSALQQAWGPPTSSSAVRQRWENEKFVGELTFNPVSANGPFWSLRIE